MTLLSSAFLFLGAGAIGGMALGRWPRSAFFAAMMGVVLAGMSCTILALRFLLSASTAQQLTVSWPLPLGSVRLVLDGLSAWFVVMIGILGMAVAIYSWSYFQDGRHREPLWPIGPLISVLIGAMILTVCAADVILFLVGWEIMSLSAFLLVGYRHGEAKARRGAWMYLVATHLGTVLFLVPMFGLLVARAGATDFQAVRMALQPAKQTACAVLFFLGLLGFGTKAGFMPMHVWLPEAHPVAPSPISALMSGVVIKIGIYGLMRLLSWMPPLPAGCAMIMLVLGMTSGVMGVLYALAQHDIKRLLAYHSVENIGIIGLGIGMGMLGQTFGRPVLMALGYGGALLHVLNHAVFKGLLFLSAGAVIHATGVGNIERLGGLSRKTPFNAAMFLVAAVSICGLPPFNGFVSEWILYGSLFNGALGASRAAAGVAALGAMSLALMGGFALACFAKVFSAVFLGMPRDPTILAHSTPSSMRIGMVILAAVCVGIGLLPGVVVPLLSGGVSVLTHSLPPEFDGRLRATLAPAGRLSGLAAVMLGIVVMLVMLRRVAQRRNQVQPVSAVPTWGCGYAAPSPRMQYTASSFAWPLVQSFRHLLWPHREIAIPVGVFAEHSRLESHTPDMAEHDLFTPLFRGVERLFQRVRTLSWSGEPMLETERAPHSGRVGPFRLLVTGVLPRLRRGSIHVCLSFIVLTLLLVFLIEGLGTPGPLAPAPPPAPAHQTTGGVSQ